MVSRGNSLGLANSAHAHANAHANASAGPSRSPSVASSSGIASDRDVAMNEGDYSIESEDPNQDDDAEEESADDSDFLDDDQPGNNSSLSLAITLPAVATPKPNSLTTPWPFNNGAHAPSPLSTFHAPPSGDGGAAPIAAAAIPASSLPHEILLHILRLLPPQSLSPALLVCKAWCQCGVELLWHKPSFTSLPSLSGMLQVIHSPDQTFPYPTFIRRLNFSSLHEEMTDKILRKLLPCVRLERLTLAGCKTLGAESLIALLSNCSRLAALDLSDVVAVNDEVCETIARNCPNLQGLNLSGCKEVTDRGMEAIARSCKGLRRIKLRHVAQLTDTPIVLLSINCPLLLEVDLVCCTRLTSLSLMQLFRTSHALRELSLQACGEITDEGFPSPAMIHALNNAREYNMVDDSITPPSPQPPLVAVDASLVPRPIPIDAPPRLRPFDHLRYLDLTSVVQLSDDAVAGIVKYMPRIRNLILAKCARLTDDAVHSICLLGKHLHYLHLGHVSSITDAAVTALARSCTRLRYIDLACCTRLTDLSVFELATNLPRLKRIGLVRVANITDEGIQALFQRTSLERIHLSYCENLSVLAIHQLLSYLPRLTHLSLTGVPSFRRPDLQTWCRMPPSNFNSHQRTTFCVYSGKGVHELRRFLRTMHAEMEAEAAAAAHWGAGGANGHDTQRQLMNGHGGPGGAAGGAPRLGAVMPTGTVGAPRRAAFPPGSLQIPPHNPAGRPGRQQQQQQQQQHPQQQHGGLPQAQQLQLHPAPPFHLAPIPPRNPASTGGRSATVLDASNGIGAGPRPSSTPPVTTTSLHQPGTISRAGPPSTTGDRWAWDPTRNTGSFLGVASSNLARAGSMGALTSSTQTEEDDRVRGLEITTHDRRQGSSSSVARRPRGATVTRGNYREEDASIEAGAGTTGSATPSESDVEME